MKIDPRSNLRRHLSRQGAKSRASAPVPLRIPPVCISALEPRILLASISGSSYADFNANGLRDAGEPALAGWTVFLDADHDLKLDAGEPSTVTNASGAYTFTVNPGNYLIVQIPKAGWTQTGPSSPDVPAAAPDTGAADTSSTSSSNLFSRLRFAPGYRGIIAGPTAVRQMFPRAIPTDPLFNTQWNFRNTGQTGGTAGMDANITTAWNTSLGTGVRIGIVDDGVDYVHADLAAGYDAAYSWDFNDNDANPAPGAGDSHGTAVGGIAIARANNGIGISGSAPGARWSALRLDSGPTTDAQQAAAIGWMNNSIDIYNNSWGPSDNGKTLEGPGAQTRAAFLNAITSGRNGKGNIFVWSAGNGLQSQDNANYDGYANQRYVIAVTAVDHKGIQSDYAEPGASILLAGFSNTGTNTSWVQTTDRSGSAGFNTTAGAAGDYIAYFSGTSATAPQVTGIVALMLQVNPNLGWRDVQAILGYTARQNDIAGGGWVTNGAGRKVSHKYGFGTVDATAAVNMASTWVNLGPEVSETSGLVAVNQTIPDGSATGVSSSVTLDSLTRIEKVEVTLSASHNRRGDLRVVLTSPDGTQSILAETHADIGNDYSSWTFTSTHHWDEIAKGTWTLTVTDLAAGTTGTLDSWKLNVYGTALANVNYAQVTSAGQAITGQNFLHQPPPSAKPSSSFIFQTTPQKVTIVFDKDVAGQISADDLVLHNDTLNQDLPTTFAYNAATRTATYTYTPASGFTVLPDGNYTATLKASGFGLSGGLHLDGNSDNLPDDDAVFTFFQLSGDADHDRSVNLNDLIRLANHYGQTTGMTWGDGDFTGDGAVDLNDLIILANHYGSTLAAADTAGADLAAIADESDTQSVNAPLFNTSTPIERDQAPQSN